jgi:hypothetical protein
VEQKAEDLRRTNELLCTTASKCSVMKDVTASKRNVRVGFEVYTAIRL